MEGTKTLLVIVPEAGGAHGQEAQDKKGVQRKRRDQDGAVQNHAVTPPVEEGLVVFEDGPNSREQQYDGQHGEQVRNVLMGMGKRI